MHDEVGKKQTEDYQKRLQKLKEEEVCFLQVYYFNHTNYHFSISLTICPNYFLNKFQLDPNKMHLHEYKPLHGKFKKYNELFLEIKNLNF